MDYDAKTNRIQKAKKEKPDLDEEMKQAQQKYEDTLQEVENLMISLEGREDSQLSALLGFLDAQFEFHTQAAKLLGDLKISIRDSSVPANRIQRPTQLFSESNASLNNLVARNGSETLTADQSQSSKTNLFSSGADASSQPSSPITNNSNRKISALSASTPLPQPPTRKLVRANYSFMAENANEISLQKGDTVTVVNEIDAGWWVGENQKNGETGLFPANYCEVIGQTASAVTGVEEARPVQPPPPRQPPLLSVLQKNSSLPRFTYTQQSQSQPQPQQAPPERPKRSESSEALEAAAAAVQQQKSAGSSPVPPKPPRRSDSPGPEQAVAPPIVKSRSQVSLSNETKPPTVPSRSPSNQDLSKVSTCQTCACSQFSPGAFKADQCKNCFHSHQ